MFSKARSVAEVRFGSLGQHIIVRRYSFFKHFHILDHHAIISNADGTRVIHFWSPTYTDPFLVRESSLRDMLGNGRLEDIRVVPQTSALTSNEIVARARSQLGRNNYNLFGDNCETFANWCVTGNATSDQVQKIGMRLMLFRNALLKEAGQRLVRFSTSVQQKYPEFPTMRLTET